MRISARTILSRTVVLSVGITLFVGTSIALAAPATAVTAASAAGSDGTTLAVTGADNVVALLVFAGATVLLGVLAIIIGARRRRHR